MSGLSQSWEEARLCRTPGPRGATRAQTSANDHASAPPSSAPRGRAQALGLGRTQGAPNSSEPHSHPGPGDSSRGRSLESDRPGLCEQLFKGSLLFRALRRRLLQVPSAHLKNILSEEHPSFHP